MPTLLALALAASSPTLWVSFHSGPTPNPCRVESFVGAIAALRPGLDVRAGSEPGEGDATAEINVENDAWRLIVQRRGQDALRRTLPAPGTDCVATSNTAALIIDRALDDLHWNGSPVRMEPMERAEAPVKNGELDARDSLEGRLELSAGAATVFGAVKPAFGLGLSTQLDRWSLGLGGLVATTAHAPVGDNASIGTYSVFAFDLQLLAGRRFPLGPGAFLLELAPGVELAHGKATGSLFQERAGTSAAFLVGARASYELALPARFALSLRAEGRLFPSPIAFNVEGYSGDFSSSHFAANLLFCVSRNFF